MGIPFIMVFVVLELCALHLFEIKPSSTRGTLSNLACAISHLTLRPLFDVLIFALYLRVYGHSMEIIVITIIGVILFVLTRGLTEPARRDQMVLIILGSYVLRLVLQYFVMRTFSFFSHGVASGDCAGYENNAIQIAKFWNTEGFYYVTVDRHPELNLSTTSLIANLLGCVCWRVLPRLSARQSRLACSCRGSSHMAQCSPSKLQLLSRLHFHFIHSPQPHF